ncbi:MAG: TetR/AcrR family transcriptional regulator [Spirochaetaceae bacterium]|nr:TetR/AcrR family transcriptional regulator [Spirochaetaceae bacterium]
MTRNEQKEERRKQILVKALELFVTKGYSETKITDISQALGISNGLLFHYYESKEQLYLALVQMGVDGTNTPQKSAYNTPLEYFEGFVHSLFAATATKVWIPQMFVLMNQAHRLGIPEQIRSLASSINQIEVSAKIIEEGQKSGVFKKGDATALAATFWSSIQGIMEEHTINPSLPLPEVSWMLDIIRA